MEHQEKRARNNTEYIVVTNDKGVEYKFKFQDEGEGFTPTTLGATDEDGLTEACDYLSDQGYNIVMGRLRPLGFEYEQN